MKGSSYVEGIVLKNAKHMRSDEVKSNVKSLVMNTSFKNRDLNNGNVAAGCELWDSLFPESVRRGFG